LGAGRGAAHRHAGGCPRSHTCGSHEATQAWVSMSISKVHSEIGEAPVTRFLAGPEGDAAVPGQRHVRLAFTRTDHRMQRRAICHRRHRRPPLRTFPPLPAFDPARGSLRRLDLGMSTSSTTDRQGAVRSLSPDRPIMPAAPCASIRSSPSPRTSSRRPACALPPADRPAGRHRTAAALSAQE